MPIEAGRAAPLGRYCRRLLGGDFSLEANTGSAAVVQADCFYVLRAGTVLLASADFEEAEALYKELCRLHWVEHLDSPDRTAGVASAWGLLGLDLSYPGAAKVIQRDGSPQDRKRLDQLRHRARAMNRTGWRRSP